MFSNRTPAEVAEDAKRIATDADIHEAALAKGDAKPMEEEADRWRASTFKTQEWMNKNFPVAKDGNRASQFRLSYGMVGGDGWYYLEELHSYSGKTVSSYRGMMCREEDLFALAEVIVAAARAKKAREGGQSADGAKAKESGNV
jgi:hypothetical protein